MPVIQELERSYSTPIHSAEISTLQPPKRVDMYPGLGRDSVLTEETGFPLWMEMDRFDNDLNFALASGKSLDEALNFATSELEVNIRTYTVEFIKSKTVLPHKNRFDVVGGVQRMVGNNGRPVLDAISSQERNGSVLEAARIVESFLLSADPNSYAVTMNPSGWSGYDLRHKNAQVMVSWKDQGGISKGLTFVTDLSEEQAKQVMINLGVSEEVLKGGNEQERLANIVRNPALLRADTNPFEYVLDKILAVRGREDISLLQKKGPPEIRSIEQTREDIKKFDELLLFDQKEEELISNLREFIMGRIYQLGDRNIQERITKEIERTVLSLAGEHLRKNPTVWKGFSDMYQVKVILNPFLQDADNFGPEITFLQSRGGCPTGGSSAIRALGGISLGIELVGAVMPSNVTMADLTDKDFCIRCGACREYIWRVVRKGGTCPKCQTVRECA